MDDRRQALSRQGADTDSSERISLLLITLGLHLETVRSDARIERDRDARTITERDDQITKLRHQFQDHQNNLESTCADAKAERGQAAERIGDLARTILDLRNRLADQ